MAQYKTWQAPVLGFFSTWFYRDVALNWKGGGLLYLLVMVALSCTVACVKTGQQLNGFVGSSGEDWAQQMPTFTITNGKLSIDKPVPYVLPEGGDAEVIIDPTGETQNLDNTGAWLLVSDHDILMKDRSSKSQQVIMDFSKVRDFRLDSNDIRNLLKFSILVVPLISYLITVPFVYGGHIIQMLVYAVIGLLVSKFINAPIGFSALLRISAVAVGCVIILDTIVQLTMVDIPFWRFMRVVIAGFYVAFGVGANLSQASTQTKALDYKDIHKMRRQAPTDGDVSI